MQEALYFYQRRFLFDLVMGFDVGVEVEAQYVGHDKSWYRGVVAREMIKWGRVYYSIEWADDDTLSDVPATRVRMVGGGGGTAGDDDTDATAAAPAPSECYGREGEVIEHGVAAFAVARDDETADTIATRLGLDVRALIALNAPRFRGAGSRFTRHVGMCCFYMPAHWDTP